jgi:hypothetical protein
MGKKSSPAVEFTQGFMEPLSGAIKAYADIAVAQANANAAIIAAQQKTAQAALGANAPILHELDRPFVTIKGRTGRGKHAAEYEVNASVLDLYALGDLAERGMMDADLIADGKTADSFSYGWDEVRSPRTQISGKPTGVTAERPRPAPQKSDWDKFVDWWNSDWITVG